MELGLLILFAAAVAPGEVPPSRKKRVWGVPDEIGKARILGISKSISAVPLSLLKLDWVLFQLPNGFLEPCLLSSYLYFPSATVKTVWAGLPAHFEEKGGPVSLLTKAQGLSNELLYMVLKKA